MQPYHAIDDGRWAEKRIGPERAKTTYAFRSLLDSGATLAFGTDWTVAPLNPMLSIYAAATRSTLDGKHPNGWIPEQKTSLEEAIRAYTVGSAFAAKGKVSADPTLTVTPASVYSNVTVNGTGYTPGTPVYIVETYPDSSTVTGWDGIWSDGTISSFTMATKGAGSYKISASQNLQGNQMTLEATVTFIAQ